MGHKYHAVPTWVDGIRFASKKEAKRYVELKLLEKAKVISELVLQPRYVLLPKTEWDSAVTYVADFEYKENGKTITEDVKGAKLPIFKMKAKMFRQYYPDHELRIT